MGSGGRSAQDVRVDRDQLAVRDMAKSFADTRIAPNALPWDETEHFPVDVFREAAALGMAAIYVGDEHGGSGMSRLDAALIFEALSTGCPCVASFLSIHNMVAWVVYGFGRRRSKAASAPPRHDGADRQLLPDEARRGLRRRGAHDARPSRRRRLCARRREAVHSGAGASDLYLVMARTGEGGPSGISAFLIEKDAPGLSFGAKEKKMDGAPSRPVR